MVKSILMTLLFSLSKIASASEGIIVVLESPLFEKPDEKSPVVQYYRKGQTIFLHSMETFFDEFEEEKFKNIDTVKADKTSDPLLAKDKLYFPDDDSLFYKTLTRGGKEAYILKEHVRITYKDRRDFEYKEIDYDHTDYRLEEPLPPKYPFLSRGKLRGQAQFGIGMPNYKSYPYPQKIIDTEPQFSKEFQFLYTSAQKIDPERRFYFGVLLGGHLSNINYLLSDAKAQQENLRLYLGPVATYDVYRSKSSLFSAYLSTIYHPVDRMKITLASDYAEKEIRNYQSYFSFSQIIGISYQAHKAVNTFDFVTGLYGKVHFPKFYQTSTAGNESSYWSSTRKDDNFDQPFTAEVSLYLGFQSYYE